VTVCSGDGNEGTCGTRWAGLGNTVAQAAGRHSLSDGFHVDSRDTCEVACGWRGSDGQAPAHAGVWWSPAVATSTQHFCARKKNMQRLTRCNTAARPQGCRRGWKHGCTENEDTCFGRESALSREFTHEHTRSSTPQPCAVLLPKMPQQQSAKMRGRKALDMCVVILRT
jgi:hypothetical protein